MRQETPQRCERNAQQHSPEADNLLAVPAPVLELLGAHELGDLQVERRRLQVLPEGQDVHAGRLINTQTHIFG